MNSARYHSLLRFSLRLVFIVLSALALGLGVLARHAQQQRLLISEIDKANGTFQRRSVSWIPHRLRTFLGEDHGSYVVEVSVGGMITRPTVALSIDGRLVEAIDPRALDHLLSLNAMCNVEVLKMFGTAVSDQLILDQIDKLPKLKSLRLHNTVVTEDGIERLRSLKPACEFLPFFPNLDRDDHNGAHVLQSYHRDQLQLTKDLSLLRLVENGDPRAVRDLLAIAAKHEPRYASVALESLRRANSTKARDVMREGLTDSSPQIRRLAVEALGMLGDFDALSEAIGDDDNHIRLLRLRYLVKIDRQRAFGELVRATSDTDAQIRWLAVDSIGGFENGQALDLLIDAMVDDSNAVRSAAARGLGSFDHPRTLEALERALQDEDHFVRTSASKALDQLRPKQSTHVE